MVRPLLLASRSPRRGELLRAAGIGFEVGPAPDVDESVPALAPHLAVEALARRKAAAVSHLARERVVLVADTLVFLDGQPLGKPADPAEAVRMLRTLSGRAHEVMTGVAVVAPDGRGGVRLAVAHAVTRVVFRELSDAEIEAYVASGEPLDKAGAYAIQGGARAFVSVVDGPQDNVVGLPVELVRTLLATLG